MPDCFECGSTRVIEIVAKCPEGCKVYIGDGIFHEGDIPMDLEIGGPDEITFSFCAICSRIQGNFPLDETELEAAQVREED